MYSLCSSVVRAPDLSSGSPGFPTFFDIVHTTMTRVFVEMSRKGTVMNEVNSFASVTFGHCACGKSKHGPKQNVQIFHNALK